MKKKYQISGMTCNGCRSSVESVLKAVPGVIDAVVNLENNEGIVTIEQYIPVQVFQKVLSDKYVITEKKERIENSNIVMNQEQEENTQLKQLFPLFLIFGYITVASILRNDNPWSIDSFMLDFMGLFYIVFSFFKILDLKGFVSSFGMYDPLAKVVPSYGWIYPFMELVLGFLFLYRLEIPIALVATLIVLGITTIGVVKVILDKKTIRCACLGTVLKLPMTKATIIENVIMIGMAISMLISIIF